MHEDVIAASNKIERAAKLKEQISDLDYFIHVLDVAVEFPKDTTAFLTRTTETVKETTYKIFGSRHYGCGTAKQEIKVPSVLIKELVVLAKKQRDLLMIELNLIVS